MSCWWHGYPWPSLATFPYRPSPQAGLLDNIPYSHIFAECMFVIPLFLATFEHMTYCLPYENHRLKIKESKKIHKYLDLARQLEMLENMKLSVISIVVGALGMIPKGIETRLYKSETRGRIGTVQTVLISQNTEKSPGYLRRLAVPQNPIGNLLCSG